MKYEKEYLPADKYVIINKEDSVIRPVVLRLPDPPDVKLIDGYGLPKVEQKFQRKETPDKLISIEHRARKNIQEFLAESKGNRANGYHIQKEFWRIIEEEKDSLENEITWIWNNWWYLRYGYWFYCYGKPTWITPWHFHFLTLHYINEARKFPDYRDVDRRTEIGSWYAFTCTETFKNVDDDGNALDMEMYDVGTRLFLGDIQPKRRRKGLTAQSLSKGEYIVMNNKSAYADIIADEGDHSEGIFKKKLAPAWYHMPLWAKPVWDGDELPSTAIDLTHPKTVLREECLGSRFGYTKKSTERAKDSEQLMYILCDEEGKGAVRADVSNRWAITKETLAQDLIIHGWSSHPSTIEEMKDGGAVYHSMFEMSNFYIRKPSGQTLSGLFPIFTPAYDGMDGFIDAWGYSVIDNPTEDQIKYAPPDAIYAKRKIGAKESIQNELNAYLNDGSYEKLLEYRKLLRKKPMDSTDCWKGQAGDMGFNIIKIDKAIVDARYKKVYQGNFYWAIPDKVVAWRDDPKGRWFVSDFFVGRSNKWRNERMPHQDPETGEYKIHKAPANSLITNIGADPFRGRTATQAQSREYGENTNLSDGGIAVYLNPDSSINGDLPVEEWPTPKFICTYRYRGTLDQYCEDLIMTAFYYGGKINGERNTEYPIQYIIKRGFGGYLCYMMGADGKIALQPWIYSGGINNQVKGDMINETMQHIENHVHNESHIDLLNEWKGISCPEDFHKFDLAAAAGWAIYASYHGYQKKYERLNQGRVINLQGTWLDPKKRKTGNL